MSMCTMRLIKGSEPIRPQTSPTPGPSGAAVSYGLRRVAGVSVTGQIYLMGERRLTWSDWLCLRLENRVRACPPVSGEARRLELAQRHRDPCSSRPGRAKPTAAWD